MPGTQKFSVPQSMPSTLKSVLGSVHTLFGVHIGTILHTLFGMHCIPIFLQCNNQVDFVCLFVCLYIRLFKNNFEVQRIKYMSEYISNWCLYSSWLGLYALGTIRRKKTKWAILVVSLLDVHALQTIPTVSVVQS